MNHNSGGTFPVQLTFVLGMHRSGSSALARVLNLAGLRISSQLLPANQDNPSGYWEPQRVVSFNTALLEVFDRHWADPKPMPTNWDKREVGGHDFTKIADLLRVEASQCTDAGSNMVIKDPRLSRLMPYWRQALDLNSINVTCLIMCRHPLSVAESLYARDRIPQEHALALWLSYMLEAEAGTRGMSRCLVHYEHLLTNWQETLDSIRWNSGEIIPEIAESQGNAIDQFLDPALRHHQVTSACLSSEDPLHRQVNAAYQALLANACLEDTQTFERLCDEREKHWNMTSPGPQRSGLAQAMPAWHAERSWIFVAQGDHSMALAELDIAISLAPDVGRFHHLRGNALGHLGRTFEAMEAHRKAVKLAPKVARFHRALCDSLDRLGLHCEAAIALGDLASLNSDAQTHHQHGLWLARAGHHTEAASAQRKAIILDNSRPDYHRALASALTHINQEDEACVALRRAIFYQPTDATLLDWLGDLEAGADRWEVASDSYDKAVKLRYMMFGFRTNAPAPPQQQPYNHKPQLLGLLSRLAARHWATDLMCRLMQAAATNIDSMETWPRGPKVQDRPCVPISSGGHTDNNGGPLLSVMIPVYRVTREAWLLRCITSVLQQDRGKNWAEIVVVDDASGDSVAEDICKKFNGRVSYVRNPNNLGLIGNHNRCLSLARGAFIHILHQDDFVEDGFYDSLLTPLVRDEQLVAGFTHNRFVNDIGHVLSTADPPRPPRGTLQNWQIRLSLEIRIQFPSIVVRRSTYHQVGGFFPARRFSFDWDLWNRVANVGPIWYEPKPLAMYRIHQSSATQSFSMTERVVDAMQTVAAMVQLVPDQHRRATAEMGMYKFLRRYWGLATEAGETGNPECTALKTFLLQGWATSDEANKVLALLSSMK
jgi:Flp pilus assembly protein TadD/GT2 family glycosyltransferase